MRWKKLQQEYMEARGLKQTVDRETIVFSNPNNELKSYGYSNFQRSWKDVLDAVGPKLKGHRFSPHPYTIYSMRSTFIEDHLLKGTPVYEVAEMAGHSVMETQKTYARLNLRNKGREITMPNMGKKERQRKGVELF
jgi:integrase